jgi:hypothetical protein
MIFRYKQVYLILTILLLPILGICQHISIKGFVNNPGSSIVIMERLKKPSSWKVWQGSNYNAKIDSAGNFNLLLPLYQSGMWKISIGRKKLRIRLNIEENIYLELDSSLIVKKIIRHSPIDSPLNNTF